MKYATYAISIGTPVVMLLHSQRLQNLLVESDVGRKREQGGHLVLQGGADGFQHALYTMYYLVLKGGTDGQTR